MLNVIPTIRRGLIWRISNGGSSCIGIDPWIRCGNSHLLPLDLIENLNKRDIYNTAHIGDPQNSTVYQQAWLSGTTLDIPTQWHMEWRTYLVALS